MLWNLTISASGISSVVRHAGVAVVLHVLSTHDAVVEVVQNALGVLRNLSDVSEGQDGILRSSGIRLLIHMLRTHAG